MSLRLCRLQLGNPQPQQDPAVLVCLVLQHPLEDENGGAILPLCHVVNEEAIQFNNTSHL